MYNGRNATSVYKTTINFQNWQGNQENNGTKVVPQFPNGSEHTEKVEGNSAWERRQKAETMDL